MQVDALVIAGGRKDKLNEYSDIAKEALIPIGNKVMVEYVVNALENAKSIRNIIVVGPIDELRSVFKSNSLLLAPEGESAIDSVINGLKVLQPKGKVLIITGDIPLINSLAIEGFLELCVDEGVDIFYPVVPKEINEKNYPNVKRTYVKLKEGTFTGGNLFLIEPYIVEQCAQKGRQLVRLRKSPIKLSSLIGWMFIMKFLLRKLTLEEVEEKFSRLLGVKGKAVISPFPEVGIDVDKPSDLQLVKEILL